MLILGLCTGAMMESQERGGGIGLPCTPLCTSSAPGVHVLDGLSRVMCTELARIALLWFGIGLLSCAVVLTKSVCITLA